MTLQQAGLLSEAEAGSAWKVQCSASTDGKVADLHLYTLEHNIGLPAP